MVDVFFSTLNSKFYDQEIDKSIDDLLKAGTIKIEISSGHKYEKDFFQKLLFYKKEKNVNFLIHNYAPPEKQSDFLINIASNNRDNRNKSIDFIKSRIELTKLIGADYYSFHGGFCVDSFEEIGNQKILPTDKEIARKIFIKSIQELSDFAEAINIKLGFENNVVEKGNEKFLITYEKNEIKEVFDRVKNKNLFLHLDAGHLNVTAKTIGFDKVKFLKTFKDKIYAIHVSKNNGFHDEHLKINKSFWLMRELKIIKKIKYLIVETKGPVSKEYMRKTKKYFNHFD